MVPATATPKPCKDDDDENEDEQVWALTGNTPTCTPAPCVITEGLSALTPARCTPTPTVIEVTATPKPCKKIHHWLKWFYWHDNECRFR